MAINASYSFTPAVPGGTISVTGATESEIKTKVLAALQARRDTAQTQVEQVDTAITGMNM